MILRRWKSTSHRRRRSRRTVGGVRLSQLQQAQGGAPLAIAVLEKAREAGAHLLSGAVLDPSSLRELMPDFREQGAPIEADVCQDRVYMLYAGGKIPLPLTPPPLRNHGNLIISVSRFGKWLAERVEAAGVDLFTGFPGVEVLFDGDRVIGVRTGDRGIGRDGQRRGDFRARRGHPRESQIFCDGVRGNLTSRSWLDCRCRRAASRNGPRSGSRNCGRCRPTESQRAR